MIQYSEDYLFLNIFRIRGSVAPRSLWFAIPSAILAGVLVHIDDILGESFREASGILAMNSSQLWAVMTGCLTLLLSLRTNRAMSRFWEGTGLLHQMRGEWFDSVSCCVTFSRAARAAKPREVDNFRQCLVRLMSLCHGYALKEIGASDLDEVVTVDAYGLNDETLEHLRDCTEKFSFNRVEASLHMIQVLITQNLEDGVLKIPPPILSRVYQTLSRGFVNQLNAKKIADVRFPFPYVQVIAFLLLVNSIATPMIMASVFDTAWMAAICAFLPTLAFHCLNFTGVELENPFGKDANDLPLDHFQDEMNSCLVMLLHSSADIMPAVDSSRMIPDTLGLRSTMVAGGGRNRLSEFRSRSEDSVELAMSCQRSIWSGPTESNAQAPLEQPKALQQTEASPKVQEVERMTTEGLVFPAVDAATPPPPGSADRARYESPPDPPSGKDFEEVLAALQSIQGEVAQQNANLMSSVEAIASFTTGALALSEKNQKHVGVIEELLSKVNATMERTDRNGRQKNRQLSLPLRQVGLVDAVAEVG